MKKPKKKPDKNAWFDGLPPKERDKAQLMDLCIQNAQGFPELLGTLERCGVTRVYFSFAPHEDHNKAWQWGIDCPRLDNP